MTPARPGDTRRRTLRSRAAARAPGAVRCAARRAAAPRHLRQRRGAGAHAPACRRPAADPLVTAPALRHCGRARRVDAAPQRPAAHAARQAKELERLLRRHRAITCAAALAALGHRTARGSSALPAGVWGDRLAPGAFREHGVDVASRRVARAGRIGTCFSSECGCVAHPPSARVVYDRKRGSSAFASPGRDRGETWASLSTDPESLHVTRHHRRASGPRPRQLFEACRRVGAGGRGARCPLDVNHHLRRALRRPTRRRGPTSGKPPARARQASSSWGSKGRAGGSSGSSRRAREPWRRGSAGWRRACDHRPDARRSGLAGADRPAAPADASSTAWTS